MSDFEKYDLHCHSTCSDGTSTPNELLEIAKNNHLTGLSITDHDTIDAYTDELFAKAKELGLQLLTGVEFSCLEKGTNVHILGYGFDPLNDGIRKFCQKHIELREIRNKAIIAKMAKKGFKVTYEDLLAKKTQENQVLGRPHIAQLLIDLGHVKNMAEAFDHYLADGRSCYVEPATPSIEESIQVIHQAGGIAVLAHPHLFRKRRILKEILKKPFDVGLSATYARVHRNIAEDYAKIALEKNWLITGGSDFHGSSKPYLSLGASFIQKELYLKILAKLGK